MRVAKSKRLRGFARQVGIVLGSLFVVSLITFAATSLKSPEAVAHAALGRTAPPAQVRAFIKRNELDGSLPERYVRWFTNFVQGDWGESPVTRTPVTDQVGPRIRNTMILAAVALVASLIPSLWLGMFLARRRGSPADIAATTTNVVVAALPEFVVGIVLIYLLAITLGWLPVDSSGLTLGGLGQQIEAFILPALTLAIVLMPHFTRMVRAATADVLAAPYVRSAILRGLPVRTIMWRHVLPNAAGPIISTIAVNIIWLIGGVIVVENVFGLPGIGQRLVQAVAQGDTATVQALAMVTGVLFLAVGVASDVLVKKSTFRQRA